MRKNNWQRLAMAASIAMTAITAAAEIPTGYYASLKGKKGAALKTAVHEIIKSANVLSYGSGSGSTWWGFYVTDNDNGYVIDRYSNERVKFSSRGSAPSSMNIEHSFPKSWWGGSKTQAYKDLFNLMPSDQKANSSKGNYGMGVVKEATYDNGCIKIGTGTEGFKVWQPSKEWQGDFSRGYMYMATAYQDYKWSNAEAFNSLQQGDYPTLKKWAYTLYIKWAKEDPVSQTEIDRNEAVYQIQGNRNPFIDFPNLMEYVWGDSVDVAFNPETTVKATDYNNGNKPGGDDDTPTPPADEDYIYDEDFTLDEGACTIVYDQEPETAFEIWQNSAKYGWTANGYQGSTKTRHASDVTLWMPELDLTNYSHATLTFNHAVNYCTTPEDYLTVVAKTDKGTTPLTGITWPAGNSYTYIESGEVSLNAFAGQKVAIGFRYTSTTELAPCWEIKRATVTAGGTYTGISEHATDKDSTRGTAWTIDGRRVNGHYKGLIIKNGKKYVNR